MSSTRALKILIVEDHADSRKIIGMFLEMLGHCCQLAPDAGSALTKAAHGSFDVLLTDVHMPGMDGWELVQELGRRGHLPVLVISMSAGVQEGERAKSKEVGCHAHLLKPFPVGELEAALLLAA